MISGIAAKVSRQACCSFGARLTGHRTHFNQPKGGNELYRAGGISSLFRLPIQENQPEGLDACFVGVPMDIGCSNRSGTRHGPRAIRHESAVVRHISDNGACPFESLQVADIGDVPVIPYNMQRTIDCITDDFLRIVEANCVPLAMGGDHTMSYPILRAIKKRHGTVGLIQIDAHQDLQDEMLGEKVAHGTPFRRALEEDLVDPKHFVQIGLRGSMYESDMDEQIEWAKKQGVIQIPAYKCWHKSLTPLMNKIRSHFKDIPTYFTFDIDAIDPTNCPGTGTPEIAGLTPIQAVEIVRGLKGLNIIGGDVVEVNPQYDKGGITALMGANLLYEMLCILPGVKYMKMECGEDLMSC